MILSARIIVSGHSVWSIRRWNTDSANLWILTGQKQWPCQRKLTKRSKPHKHKSSILSPPLYCIRYKRSQAYRWLFFWSKILYLSFQISQSFCNLFFFLLESQRFLQPPIKWARNKDNQFHGTMKIAYRKRTERQSSFTFTSGMAIPMSDSCGLPLKRKRSETRGEDAADTNGRKDSNPRQFVWEHTQEPFSQTGYCVCLKASGITILL